MDAVEPILEKEKELLVFWSSSKIHMEDLRRLEGKPPYNMQGKR